MRDYTETDDTVTSSCGAALESDGNSVTRGEGLRDDAEYASLARHAVTDIGRALIAAVCQQIEDWEARQGARRRKRDGKAPAFARAIEGFVADLLIAAAHEELAEGWVRRSVGHSRLR